MKPTPRRPQRPPAAIRLFNFHTRKFQTIRGRRADAIAATLAALIVRG